MEFPMETTIQKVYLSIDELTEMIGIPKSTQAALRSHRKIPFHKVGRMIKYKICDINAWIENGKVV